MHKHAHARAVWGHASAEKILKLGALRSLLRPYLPLVQLEYMARVIPPFATIHVSRHEAFQSL